MSQSPQANTDSPAGIAIANALSEVERFDAAWRPLLSPTPEPRQCEAVLGTGSSNANDLPDVSDCSRDKIQSLAALDAHPEIAGYLFVSEIHRGGQGIVYHAFHESTQRDVAIKLLHHDGAARPRDRQRFELEAQVLRELNHPNIITVLDIGEIDGRQYLIMPFVESLPIDQHVAEAGLGSRQTLELFARVCDAVGAAHLAGVIHRDIKPGNILIDDADKPFVVDFGLAKMHRPDSDGGPAARPMLTEAGQFVGSLPWASPEQAEGLPGTIDMRTDVYSLGAVLYYLLTGRYPIDPSGSQREVLNRIVSAEPASLRRVRSIDSELDTLVLKCLCKDRARRYPNAGSLAADIRRYLAGDAIEARQDSWWYVARKKLRRHWLAATAVIGWVSFASMSCLIAFVLLRQEMRAKVELKQKNDELAATAEMMEIDLRLLRAERTTAMNWLRRRYASHGDAAKYNPRLALELRANTQSQMASLGEHEEAVALARKTVEYAARDFGPSSEQTARALGCLVARLANAKQFGEALAAFEDEWKIRFALAKDQRSAEYEYYHSKANFLVGAQRFDETEVAMLHAHALAQTLFSANSLEYAGHLYGRGDQLSALHRFDEAEQCLQEAVRITRASSKSIAYPHFDRMLHSFGVQLLETGKFAEAEAVLREALARSVQAYPPGDSREYYTFITTAALGWAVARQNRFAESAPLLENGFEGFLPPAQLNMDVWRVQIVERIVQMYKEWDRDEPDRGLDAKICEWTSTLDRLRPAP